MKKGMATGGYGARFFIPALILLFVGAATPQPADASRFSLFIGRACARQATLGDRLMRLLIDPALCAPAAAPTLAFTATPSSIEPGGASLLEWNAQDATRCVASGAWRHAKSLAGSATVSPQATATYTLTCTGAGGSIAKSVTITVAPAPAPVPALAFSANPASVPGNGTTTLAWSAENVSFCEASGGWSGERAVRGSEIAGVSTTTTYTLACGGAYGTTSESVTVESVPAPVPPVGHLLISEVYYDVDPDHGTNSSGGDNNEWIEIYNPTGAPADLSGWSLLDNTLSDAIPDGTKIEPGAYLVITATSTTAAYWALDADVVVLGNSIGNNLSAGGDAVFLRDAEGSIIDGVSWGDNVEAFDPAAPDVPQGHSLRRESFLADTDSQSDWVDADAPTPGR